jgi:hypothetical protein
MSDLQRMRMTASGEYERQQEAAQLEQMTARTEATMKAQARKEHMRRLGEDRKFAHPPSALEAERLQAKARVLSDAEKKLSEELDDVKNMNQMCLYAKIVTIRDAQVSAAAPDEHVERPRFSLLLAA